MYILYRSDTRLVCPLPFPHNITHKHLIHNSKLTTIEFKLNCLMMRALMMNFKMKKKEKIETKFIWMSVLLCLCLFFFFFCWLILFLTHIHEYNIMYTSFFLFSFFYRKKCDGCADKLEIYGFDCFLRRKSFLFWHFVL